MLLHCVLLRFKADVSPAERQAIYEAIGALKAVIPGILAVKGGRNVSPEGLDAGFRDGFVVTFETLAARDAYLVHPDHLAAGARITAAAEGGTAGILVFDLSL